MAQPPPPPTPYRFSNEEIRVLQECNRESFYQRCLPFSTVFGISTYMGVKSGFLKPNSRFGSAPKVIAAVIIGFIMGKVSYQGKCAEKLMALPNSRVGALLRSRKFGGTPPETLMLEDKDIERVVTDIPESEKYSDITNKSSMDLDIDRPLSSGLDDYRPSLDDIRMDDGIPPRDSTKSTTYDELRRKNREDFIQKKTKPYRGVIQPEDVPSGLNPVDQPAQSGNIPRPTNVYGDIWER